MWLTGTGGQECCANRVVQRHSAVHHHQGRGCVIVPPGKLMFLHWNRRHITISFSPPPPTADRESDILKAFKMISNSTCIRFKPHTTEFNYLEFRLGKGWDIFSVSGWVSVCAKCLKEAMIKKKNELEWRKILKTPQVKKRKRPCCFPSCGLFFLGRWIKYIDSVEMII